LIAIPEGFEADAIFQHAHELNPALHVIPAPIPMPRLNSFGSSGYLTW
jgi:hypothetical protein